MKRNVMKGTGSVFRFTLADLCMSKGWLLSTILLIVILLYGVPLLMYLIFSVSGEDSAEDSKISSVYICDETAGEVDYSYLKERGYADATYTAYQSVEDAKAAIADKDETLVVRISSEDMTEGFDVVVYLPEETELSKDAAHAYTDFLLENFDGVKQQKANASEEMTAILSKEIHTSATVLDAEGKPVESENMMEDLLLMIIPFFVVMVIYMMVLMYGQQLGNSILLEKTNKLMDTMLISIHPFALILGKLSAVVVSAVLQFMLWIFAGLGGFAAGFVFIAPSLFQGTSAADSEAAVSEGAGSLLLEVFSGEKYFTLPGIAWTLAIIVVGFLLYLSLASISGALSSKPEDLGKTNIIFVMALVVSFFMCLNMDSENMSLVSNAAWLRYFPFTAMLVMPGKLLTGEFTHLEAFLSTLCIFVSAILLVYVAAMLYQLLVLYRGNPPSIKQLIAMIKESKASSKKSGTAVQESGTKE